MTRGRLLSAVLLALALLRTPATAGDNHGASKPERDHPAAPAAQAPAPPAAARPAPAAPQPGGPTCAVARPAVGAIVVGCRLDAHPFRGLAAGYVDYCRGHLGYAPGAPDCYAFADEVCTVYLPANAAWTETRQTLAGEAFPCPDAPEPPVCPRLTWR